MASKRNNKIHVIVFDKKFKILYIELPRYSNNIETLSILELWWGGAMLVKVIFYAI